MISSRCGWKWNGWQRPGAMLARTSRSFSAATTSGRQSHSLLVHGFGSRGASATCTKHRVVGVIGDSGAAMEGREGALFRHRLARFLPRAEAAVHVIDVRD